jgi:hypothetical protein
VPQRDEPTPLPNPQQIIDEQARRIAQLEEDLRRSEAERQRLRRENDKLKEELEAARAATPQRPGRAAQPPDEPRGTLTR